MTTTDRPIVAAFDFDGTLTYYDTLHAFLIYTHGIPRTVVKLALQLPKLVTYLFGKVGRQRMKECILQQFYAGMTIEEVRVKGTIFAKDILNKYIKPNAKKRLEWHLKQGHRCILISATLDVYLEPWAQSVGIHDVISSKFQVTPQKKVTGKLEGLNCWGPEKLRRLCELLGPRESFTLYAYGDSRGDKELLASADYPFYREMP